MAAYWEAGNDLSNICLSGLTPHVDIFMSQQCLVLDCIGEVC